MWTGLIVSYAAPGVPTSFAIIGTATALYAMSGVRHWIRGRTLAGHPAV
jgi:hypothetical protein